MPCSLYAGCPRVPVSPHVRQVVLISGRWNVFGHMFFFGLPITALGFGRCELRGRLDQGSTSCDWRRREPLPSNGCRIGPASPKKKRSPASCSAPAVLTQSFSAMFLAQTQCENGSKESVLHAQILSRDARASTLKSGGDRLKHKAICSWNMRSCLERECCSSTKGGLIAETFHCVSWTCVAVLKLNNLLDFRLQIQAFSCRPAAAVCLVIPKHMK